MMKKRKRIRMTIILIIIILAGCFAGYIGYTEYNKDRWIMSEYKDESGKQGLFYTFYNKGKGTLVVIDGGSKENANQVREVIKGYGGKVDHWFVTHYHDDHVDALNEILADPQGIVIEKIYDSYITYDKYISVAKEWDSPQSLKAYQNLTQDMDNVIHLKRDTEIVIDNLTWKVLNAYQKKIKAQRNDLPNNLSLMLKVEGEEDSILFCADCHGKKMANMLIKRYGKELQAEYVQPGHHGNNSFPEKFYDVVSPKYALFDGPEWLVDSDDFTAKALMQYFKEKGVVCYDYRTAVNRFEFR